MCACIFYWTSYRSIMITVVCFSTRNLGFLSVDGLYQPDSSASASSTREGTISLECKLELCALSRAPSVICAQLQGILILAILTLVSAVGAQAGGTNSGTSFYHQDKPKSYPPILLLHRHYVLFFSKSTFFWL